MGILKRLVGFILLIIAVLTLLSILYNMVEILRSLAYLFGLSHKSYNGYEVGDASATIVVNIVFAFLGFKGIILGAKMLSGKS